MRSLVLVALGLAVCPAPAAAKGGCPVRDVRAMLAEAGQGINGRVVAIAEDHLDVVAESRYDGASIAFGETVRVHGPSLPAIRQGRIGVVLHRDRDRWTATRCDVVPAWRMANALSGLEPCPAPRVRIASVLVDGRKAFLRLELAGDVTSLRIHSGRNVRRRRLAPGVTFIVERVTYRRSGRYRASVRAEGGFGPGCGTTRRRFSTARRTITVR